MRLKKVERGQWIAGKLKLGIVRLAMGQRPPDVLRMLFYRPEILGGPLGKLTHEVMRGPSAWSVGERELFAAFVSRQNQCPF